MEKVTVKATQTHLGIHGLVQAGTEYETDKNHAAELKRNGLVEWDGEAAKPIQGQKINVGKITDNKSEVTTTAVVEQPEDKQGELIPASKEKIEKGKSKEKVEKTPTKEKKEK